MGAKLIAYKFMPTRYVEGFLTRGVLKLGAAHEFRTLEGTAGGRGDQNELQQVWDAEGTHHLDKDDPLVSALVARLPPWPAPKVILKAEKNVVVNLFFDALLFCASTECTPELAARMKSDFDADACVKISDFVEFVRLISLHPEIKGSLRKVAVSPVRYVQSKRTRKFEGLNPFEKEAEAYSWQKEIRGVFEMKQAPKEGKLIAVPSAVPLLTMESGF
jgi:hypothetical protein